METDFAKGRFGGIQAKLKLDETESIEQPADSGDKRLQFLRQFRNWRDNGASFERDGLHLIEDQRAGLSSKFTDELIR